ncbi:DUF4322 domain-containing protein [Saccharolobus islandicus]|uniref:DUF4322 domain-containing protein n=1 Tax=Saccharolobus islandicus TaxID=43080 RepID=UPI003D7C5FAD
MVTPGLPHQNNIQQIGYKLLSILDFRGKKAENLETLKGEKEIDISIDWTTKTWYGKPVEVSSEKGNSWNYATEMTKHNGKVLLLTFVTQVNEMTKDDIVKILVEQVTAMGFKIRLITLDAGFYTVDVLNFISQFKYIIGVPVGDVKVYEEFDGEYMTNSKRHRRDEQVKFRLSVYGREKIKRKKVVYFARGTNLDLSKKEALKLYDKGRSPIETSYRNIKALLPFTSSTKFVFRMLIFVLAMIFYSLYTVFKGMARREEFRLLLILLFPGDLFNLENSLFKLLETLINTIDLFLRR